MDEDECKKIEQEIINQCEKLYKASDKNIAPVLDFLFNGIKCMCLSFKISGDDYENILKAVSEDYKQFLNQRNKEK